MNTGEHTAAKASPVTVRGSEVVVPGDSGDLWRVTPDGEVVWRTTVTSASRGIHGTPAIANGGVYIGAYDGVFYALDLETGEERWRFSTDGRLIGCPTVTAAHVLIGSYDGQLYAVVKDSGRDEWAVEGVGRVTSTPLVLDGAVYFTDRASRAYLQGEGGESGGLYKVGPADRE